MRRGEERGGGEFPVRKLIHQRRKWSRNCQTITRKLNRISFSGGVLLKMRSLETMLWVVLETLPTTAQHDKSTALPSTSLSLLLLCLPLLLPSHPISAREGLKENTKRHRALGTKTAGGVTTELKPKLNKKSAKIKRLRKEETQEGGSKRQATGQSTSISKRCAKSTRLLSRSPTYLSVRSQKIKSLYQPMNDDRKTNLPSVR